MCLPRNSQRNQSTCNSSPKEKSIPIASPKEEEGVQISIHHKKVTLVSPPKVKDVTNKPAKATHSKGKGIMDVET